MSDEGVLLGVEEFVFSDAAVLSKELCFAAVEIEELFDDLVFAGKGTIERGRHPVDLRIVAKIFETGITLARFGGGSGDTFSRKSMTEFIELCRL